MAMRETEKSLKIYFFIAGLLGVLSCLSDLSDVSKLPSGLPTDWMLALWFPILARGALGIGFIMARLRLSATLPTGAVGIKKLLLLSIVVMVIDVALIAGVFGVEIGRSALINAGIGLAITAYLLASVRRLSAEAMAKTVPPAQVVS